MAHSDSILVMHKFYYCLLYLNDLQLAISIALDHLKHYPDNDLVLSLLLELLQQHNHGSNDLRVSAKRRIFAKLLKSKHLDGTNRLIVKHHLNAALQKSAARSNNCIHRRSTLRNVSINQEVILTRWAKYGPNLSRCRLPLVQSSLKNHVELIKSLTCCGGVQNSLITSGRNGYINTSMGHSPDSTDVPAKRKCHNTVSRKPSWFHQSLVDIYNNKNMMYYCTDAIRDHCASKLDHDCPRDVGSHRQDGSQLMRHNQRDNTTDKLVINCCSTHSAMNNYCSANSNIKYGKLCLTDDLSGSISGWRPQFALFKKRIFQVCNLLFININIPFMAVYLFSRVFQTVDTNSPRSIKARLYYIFNRSCDTDKQSPDIADDDTTMLFILAANCIEIALNHHNGCARFDIFSLFYFLVFIESIFTKVDFQDSDSLPSILRLVDRDLVRHQKFNFGHEYLKRSLKYHHDLFKKELSPLVREVRKNRVLLVVDFDVSNCLEDYLILSHGIFGLNLCLKVSPSLIELTRGSYRMNNIGQIYGASINPQPQLHHSGKHNVSSNTWTHRKYNVKYNMFCGSSRSPHSQEMEHSSGSRTGTIDTTTAMGSDAAQRTHPIKDLGTIPYPPSKDANLLITESTELSILLLQVLICSNYSEILCGNAIFATPGSDLSPSALLAAMTLRFILDIYIVITDDTIENMVNNRIYTSKFNTDSTGTEYISSLKNYMGHNYQLVSDNNWIFYMLFLDIDWIFHKEGIYTSSDYIKQQQLLDRVLDLDSGFDRCSPSDTFETHCRLYEQMATLLINSAPESRTALCVEEFRRRSLRWSTFDEIGVRCVSEDQDLCINREIMDIYYSDIAFIKPCFNPYTSIFTPKYFTVVKDLIYRLKSSLLLFYITQRRAKAPKF
ncbi:hypothetical protein BaOVIS_013310 [Babesia ovis]|uniref:Uncharacterized protein n=1 Tax=Babesia ovis TaxID=5869 RepID=A0A9W5TCJ0_BABOV|nr:hypothetical protein BaOVIS_013310 [Babesia ovis]